MKNPFYNDIYEILQKKGNKGLPVSIIARQVYNRHAGLFSSNLTFEKVYQNVRFFLWSQATKPNSPFTFGTQRGWYSLNPNIAQQMRLLFEEQAQQDPEKEPEYDNIDPYKNYPTLF